MKARCGRDKIILQKLKGAGFALWAANDHIVKASDCYILQRKPCGFLEAAADAVPDHGIAQFLGAGKSKAGGLVIIALAQLQDKGGHGLGNRFCGGNKILPPLKPFHRCRGA